jgi:hypothetical protein
MTKNENIQEEALHKKKQRPKSTTRKSEDQLGIVQDLAVNASIVTGIIRVKRADFCE